MTLLVSPGTAGLNRFTVSIVDYDTRRPVDDGLQTLEFTPSERPDVGSSGLTLRRTGVGTFAGEGSNLSLVGKWTIDVLVEGGGSSSVEIPLTVDLKQ